MLTTDPRVELRLQSQFPDAIDSIVNLGRFAQQVVYSGKSGHLPPCTQVGRHQFLTSLYPKSEHAIEAMGRFIDEIKQVGLSAQSFSSIIQKGPFYADRKAFLKEVSECYVRYEKNKTFLDEADIYNKAKENDISYEKIGLFANRLPFIAEEFVKTCMKGASTFERWTLFSSKQQKTTQWVESSSEAQGVQYIVDQIQKKKHSYKDITIYCPDLSYYAPLIKGAFDRASIPVAFWSTYDSIDKVSVLPFDEKALFVDSNAAVYCLGLERLRLPMHLLSEDEKGHINSVRDEPAFMTAIQEREHGAALFEAIAARAETHLFIYAKQLPLFLASMVHQMKNKKTQVLEPTALGEERGEQKRSSVVPKNISLPSIYSVRSLTQYKKCPYGFLIRECLKLSPQKSISEELNPLEVGELIHLSLCSYFKELVKQGKASLGAILEGILPPFEKRIGRSVSDPELNRITQVVQEFLNEEEIWRRESAFVPAFFEVGFDELVLKWKGKQIKLRGKIDRIDVNKQEKRFRLIDYKSGGVPPSEKEVRAGREFQLTVYAMAAEALLLKGYLPEDAFYYQVKSATRKRAFTIHEADEWNDIKEKTLVEIFRLKNDMDRTLFPPTPRQCYPTCDLKTLCESEKR